MQLEQLKDLLKAWGHATVNRHSLSRSDYTTVHVMTKVRDHAPGTRARAERELVKRDGSSRRAAMARAASDPLKGLHMEKVPMWACDPIPAANDASRPHDNEVIAVDLGIPDELRWLDDEILRLKRKSLMRYEIIRIEYCEPPGQERKAEEIKRKLKYPGKFSVHNYRQELDRAINSILERGGEYGHDGYVA